ncbi:hypothetical protein AERO9A_190017 [Aeromonas salmonicida]|nr:hypothetical protein AERO9A_190017 [Aeromonas salmonicida]
MVGVNAGNLCFSSDFLHFPPFLCAACLLAHRTRDCNCYQIVFYGGIH